MWKERVERMIKVEKLVKSFEGFRALDGMDIHVPAGSIYGLVGPNGSGKTTLIRHLAGVYRQDSGTVLIDGQPVYENTALKAKMAWIPDDLYFFLSASVRDMMQFYKGIYSSFDAERFEKLGQVFDIDPKRPMRKLSKGQQKQAAFWLSMSVRPKVLILDEPVDGLDPVMRRQVWSLIMGDVAEHGTTVLVSSHNLRELEDVCDHVGIIDHGKVLLERSLSELQENVVKVQLVLPEGVEPDPALNILHASSSGRIRTLIIRGDAEETAARLAAQSPLFVDTIPLTLEEIFIYELGGADYAVKDIVL